MTWKSTYCRAAMAAITGWCLTTLPVAAMGQSGKVTLEVDKHIADVGEEVSVTVGIQVEGQGGYERYLPPNFQGFVVAGGGMTTQSINVINWRVRRQESYSYTVMPQKEGTLTIGPAAIMVGGRMIRSPVITLKVNKGTAPPPDPSAPLAPPAGSSDPTAADNLPAGRALQSVFLHATATPAKAYQGQQILVAWSLFTQSDVRGIQVTQHPKTDFFWSEDLRTPPRPEFQRQIVDNRAYYTAAIVRRALFPTKSGTLTIGPMTAQVRTLDPFASADSKRQSNELTIEVLPLPAAGRPASFPETNVGQYDMMASLDRSSVKAGDAVTLKVVIRGTGNLSQLTPPTLTTLDGFKVYDPKVSNQLELDQEVRGEKILEYLLLPVRGGRLTVPPLGLDFFDPEAEQYRQVKTDPLQLTVTGSFPQGGPIKADGTKNVLGPNIRPPRSARTLAHHETERVQHSAIFWVMFFLPLSVLVVFSGGERLRARLTRETTGSLRRAATRRTSGHLRRANEHRREGQVSGFFSELAAAIYSQLDYQMKIRSEGLTRSELQDQMHAVGFPDELCQQVMRELDNCDFARFAPSASGAQQLDESLIRVKRLLDQLIRIVLRQRGGSA